MSEATGYIDIAINGKDYSIVQIGAPQARVMRMPELAGKWLWSADKDESKPFSSAWEAQQDAINNAKEDL